MKSTRKYPGARPACFHSRSTVRIRVPYDGDRNQALSRLSGIYQQVFHSGLIDLALNSGFGEKKKKVGLWDPTS